MERDMTTRQSREGVVTLSSFSSRSFLSGQRMADVTSVIG
jgi:hypothetical protein